MPEGMAYERASPLKRAGMPNLSCFQAASAAFPASRPPLQRWCGGVPDWGALVQLQPEGSTIGHGGSCNDRVIEFTPLT